MRSGTHDELGFDGELLNGALHGSASQRLVHPTELEEHAAGLHHGDPELGVALARSHAGLGWLLGNGLVGEDPNPHLATTLHVTGHRDTGGLDLAGGHPTRLERLDTEVTEVEVHAALGETATASAHHLAVLDFARHQHDYSASFRKCGVSV